MGLTRRISSFLNSKVEVSEEMHKNSSLVMLILRFTGLCPLIIMRKGSGLFLKLSECYVLCSYVYGFLIITAAYYIDIKENYTGKEKPQYMSKKIDGYLRNIDFNCACALVFCGIFVMPCKILHFLKYIKYINQIDSQIKPKYSKLQKYKSLIILVVYLTLHIFIDGLGFYVEYLGRKPIWQAITNFGVYAVHMVPGLVIYVSRYLANSVEMRLSRLGEVLEERYTEVKKITAGRGGKIIGKPFKPDDTARYCYGISINKLSKVYLKLMDASKVLNYLLGLNALVAAMAITCQLLTVTYFIILNGIRNKSNYTMMLYTYLIFILRVIKLLLIIEPWHSCVSQVETVKVTLCKFLTLNGGKLYRSQVRSFAMILHLHPLNFSACGFFEVNRSLYTTVFETIVTYLVISLQVEQHGAAIN